MRIFLAAVGAAALVSATSCAPVGPQPRSMVGEATPAAPAAPLVVLDEHFAQAWPDNPRGTAWFADGRYQLFARTPDHFVAVRAPIAENPQDVIVSGTFRKTGGPPGGGYGLIVGDQGLGAGDGLDQFGQFVVAEVGDRGDVGVWQRDGNRWLDIVPWKPSPAVKPDTGPNVLTVHLIGNQLAFFVNASQVAEATIDSGLRAGKVGIFTGGDLNQVAVNHFLVQQPPATPRSSQAPKPRPASSAATPPAPAARPDPEPQRPSSPELGASRPSVWPSTIERARELMARIAVDIAAIYQSFANGIDAPHSPVNDPQALREAKGHLDAASATAVELATDLQNIRDGGAQQGGR